MKCICTKEMTLEAKQYDNDDHLSSELYYCNTCGRLFVKDYTINDDSYWKEPTNEKEKRLREL